METDWNWEKQKEQPKEYQRILQCFLDRKDCCYSIHQMAQMGVGEGKSIGEWFGPNTVAQVLKKLALFDEWNSLAVYVSMDNTVVIEDIKKMCCVLPVGADIGDESPPDSLNASNQSKGTSACCPAWKPLLLIVPLRLGINQINPVYVDAFKVMSSFSWTLTQPRPSLTLKRMEQLMTRLSIVCRPHSE